MRYILPGIFLLIFLLVASCSPSTASPVSDQLARGQVIYEEGCDIEACHGTDGKGIPSENGFRVWPLVGEDFQRRNPTAQVVFDVVRSGGESSLRALTDQQVYDSIAYELSLNGVQLSEPLDSQNAPILISGAAAEFPDPGSLFPPPGNAELLSPWPATFPQGTLSLPISAKSDNLRMRVTQLALAASIGARQPSNDGYFVFVVITLEDLANEPLEVGPNHLSLVTADGQTLSPQDIGLAYPVARFYTQTIQPEHGTAALVIFDLPEGAEMNHLQYKLPQGEPLILGLTQ